MSVKYKERCEVILFLSSPFHFSLSGAEGHAEAAGRHAAELARGLHGVQDGHGAGAAGDRGPTGAAAAGAKMKSN